MGDPDPDPLAASHTTELAEKWGRRVRNLIGQHSATLMADQTMRLPRMAATTRCTWLLGVDPENRMYLLDLWRGQTSPIFGSRLGATWCGSGSRALGRGAGADHFGRGPVPQAARDRAAGYTAREQFVSRGDKAVRAQSMRGRMAMLGLYVRQGAPWFADLRAELLSFPAGGHDDQVDPLGLVGQLLDKISPRQPLMPPDRMQPDAYRPTFEEMPNDSWKTM